VRIEQAFANCSRLPTKNAVPFSYLSNPFGANPKKNVFICRGLAFALWTCPRRLTLLLQNGESLAYVRDQLGHSSIRMTVDTYGHLVPGANRQAVNKLPALDESDPIELPLKSQVGPIPDHKHPKTGPGASKATL